MFSLFLLMLMLGVANWFATTLLVESEIFRPLREWVGRKTETAKAGWQLTAWEKARYMIGCHMCAGTWVALAMALFVPPVVNVPVAGYLLTALVIKGIGHLVLLRVNMGNARIALDKAETMEATMSAMPDLGSLLDGLLEREMNQHLRSKQRTARNDQGRRNQASASMFGDLGRMPKDNGGKFEPFTQADLDEMDKPEPAAWNKPETKF